MCIYPKPPIFCPYQVLHPNNSPDWTLHIKLVTPSDAGIYECQVNSDAKISRLVNLIVKGKDTLLTNWKIFNEEDKLLYILTGLFLLYISEKTQLDDPATFATSTLPREF